MKTLLTQGLILGFMFLVFVNNKVSAQDISHEMRAQLFSSRFELDPNKKIVPARQTGVVKTAYWFAWPQGRSQESPSNLARLFLTVNADWLGFDFDDQSLIETGNRTHLGVTHVYFQQYHNKVKVDGATANISYKNGKIISFVGDLYPSVNPSGVFLTKEEAGQIFVSFAQQSPYYFDSVEFEIELMIFPVAAEFHRGVRITTLAGATVDISGTTNQVIYHSQGIHGLGGTAIFNKRAPEPESIVFKSLYPSDIREENVDIFSPFSFAPKLVINGRVYTSEPTNPDNGTTAGVSTVVLDDLDSPGDKLKGTFAKVKHDNAGTTVFVAEDSGGGYMDYPNPTSFETACQTTDEQSSVGYKVENHDCSDFDAANVYYHITKMGQYADDDTNGLGFDVGTTTGKIPQIEIRIHTEDRDGGGWSKFSNKLVEFGHRTEEKDWEIFYDPAKFRDVIYHEYTHILEGVAGLSGTGTYNNEINEGVADFFTASFTDDPIIAEGYINCPINQWEFPAPQGTAPDETHLRKVNTSATEWNASNLGTKNYNRVRCQGDDGVEISVLDIYVGATAGNQYEYGMMWAGALWDLRAGATNDLAAERLVFDSIIQGDGSAGTRSEALNWLLFAYQQNPSRYSGLSYSEIISVFADRGIVPESIDSDLTIASGTTTTYLNEALVFGDGVKLTVNGTLNATNTTFNDDGTSKWDGIEFTSGAQGTLNNVIIDNVDVGAGGGVIKILSGNALVTIKNSKIYNETGIIGRGIIISSSSDPQIDGNEITSSKGHAIEVTSWSDPKITRNLIKITGSSSNAAVNVESSSDPGFLDAGNSIYHGENQISGSGYAIRAKGSGTSINAGLSSVAEDNELCTTGTYIIRSEQSAVVYAEDNHWPSGSSSGLVELLTSGTADTDPVASGNSSCTSPGKNSLPLQANSITHTADHEALRAAAALYYEGNLAGAEASLVPLLSEEIENDVRDQAVARLVRIAIDSENQQLLSYVDVNYVDGFKTRDMFALALLHGYHALGNEKEAARVFRALVTGLYQHETVFQAKIDRVFYWMMNGQISSAAIIWNSLNPVGSDQTNMAELARTLVFTKGGVPEPASKRAFQSVDETNYSDQGLMENVVEVYPNPFNPTTTIQLNLKIDSQVRIEIFDALGRSVEVIASGYFKTGQHRFQFNATARTSGLYFVRTIVDGVAHTVPALLLK